MNIKNLLLSLIFTVASLLTLPAYAWPEVDHMNMCGSATKPVQSYSGSWKGWNQHDQYVSRRGKSYYLQANCPKTVAPVKNKAKAKKKSRKVAAKAKVSKRTVKYDEHADCARVDKMNGYGSSVVTKRKYNYFKK